MSLSNLLRNRKLFLRCGNGPEPATNDLPPLRAGVAMLATVVRAEASIAAANRRSSQTHRRRRRSDSKRGKRAFRLGQEREVEGREDGSSFRDEDSGDSGDRMGLGGRRVYQIGRAHV